MELLADIRSHLSEIASDPAGKVLDPRLLEKFDGQVTGVQPAVPSLAMVFAALNFIILTSCRIHPRGRQRCPHSSAG